MKGSIIKVAKDDHRTGCCLETSLPDRQPTLVSNNNLLPGQVYKRSIYKFSTK